MKILAITNIYPSPERPWFGTFVEQQIKGLRSAGVEVEVLYFDRKSEGPFIYYRMATRLQDAIARFEPDLLHVMYGGVMAAKITAHPWARPVVVTFHGSDLLGENLSGLRRKLISHYGVRCSRKAARRAAGVIVVARHLLNALPSSLHRQMINSQLPSSISHLPPVVRVIPCGIDLERFQPMDQDSCRHQLGWTPDTFHVLFPANGGDPVKRPWLARAAVEALKAQGVKADLHLLSGVPYAEVPLWINASDVVILTSLHEGSPTVVKEALACTVPVVSVAVGDVAERIAGVEGCHLAAAEPSDLARKLQAVRNRNARINAGPALAAVSIGNVAERLKVFYRELMVEQVPGRAPGAGRTMVDTAIS